MTDRQMFAKKPTRISLALWLLCLGSAPLLPLQAQSNPPPASNEIVLDQIRAVVNEGVVLDSDIAATTDYFKMQARINQQTLPPDAALSNRVMEELINQEILRQRARSVGISTDAASVNRAIEQVARNNNMDALQFRETLQNQGFDYDFFRKNIEQELLLQRLIEREVKPRIRVTQQEIDDYVESIKNDVEEQQRYRIQHILIAVPPNAPADVQQEAEARAQAVLKRLRAGSDFAEVATTSSDGARALQGGDLGWRTLQELPEFLSTALQNMAPGDLSEPLRSANGLHVIRLVETQSDNQTELSETLARHIFIAGDDPTVERRLSQIRKQIIDGGSFKELAREYSEDPNSANNGGELPWFSDGQMPPAMESVADALKVDDISQPFRTQYGWHIMQVLDRRTRDIDDNTLREQAANALSQSKVEQEIERWLRQLRDESFVEIRN